MPSVGAPFLRGSRKTGDDLRPREVGQDLVWPDKYTNAARVGLLLNRPLSEPQRASVEEQLGRIDERHRVLLARGAPTAASWRALYAAGSDLSRSARDGYGRDGVRDTARAGLEQLHSAMSSWAIAERPLTLGLIREMHRLVTNGLADLGGRGAIGGVLRGTLKDVPLGRQDIAADDDWANRRYLPARSVVAMLEEMLTRYRISERAGMHPIVLAAEVYQWMLTVHPFFDANGRISRAVAEYVLVSHGYPPALLEGAAELDVALFPGRRHNVAPDAAMHAMLSGVSRSLDMLGAPRVAS